MRYHPQLDDQGCKVLIKSPSNPSLISAWADPACVATVLPGGDMPEQLNGIVFCSWWEAPKNDLSWQNVPGQNPDINEPSQISLDKDKISASGVVVIEEDDRIWLCSPTNAFGGYKNVLPKGRLASGLNFQANAIREAFEETGLQVRLVDFLFDVERNTTVTRYYLARRVGGNPAEMGWESQAVHLVPRVKLHTFLNHPNDELTLKHLVAVA